VRQEEARGPVDDRAAAIGMDLDGGPVRAVGAHMTAAGRLQLTEVVVAAARGEGLCVDAQVEVGPEGEVQPRLHRQRGAVDEGEDVAAAKRLRPAVLPRRDVLPRIHLTPEGGIERDLPARVGYERKPARQL